MRTSVHFGAKNSDFLKFMVYPHGQGGLSQYGHFTDKGERVNFPRISADVLYGGPLTVSPFAFKLETGRYHFLETDIDI